MGAFFEYPLYAEHCARHEGHIKHRVGQIAAETGDFSNTMWQIVNAQGGIFPLSPSLSD